MYGSWKAAGVALVTAVALGVGSFAYAAPMEPVGDDWNDLTATFDAVGGMDAFNDGPPTVAQAFIDDNVLVGSTL